MKSTPTLPVVTHIPMKIKIRGGKTVMVLPDGSRAVEQREVTIDNALVKVILQPIFGHQLH